MSPVDSRCSVIPAPNGFVCFATARCVGAVWESTDMSFDDSISGVKAACDGQVNLPACMNPKNPRQKAAQSIVRLKLGGSSDHAW